MYPAKLTRMNIFRITKLSRNTCSSSKKETQKVHNNMLDNHKDSIKKLQIEALVANNSSNMAWKPREPMACAKQMR